MTTPGTEYVRRQVEGRFYAEALYFGALELARSSSPELHLYLGLACAGASGGVADVQRLLHGDPNGPKGDGRPVVGNATRLVYEAFYHLLEAARQGVGLPATLGPLAAEILDDLQWYLLEDLKGVMTGRKHTARDVGCGAAVLLHRLLKGAPPLREDVAWSGEELVNQELNASGGDAAFYPIL
jgi:hypothetical protein